MTVASVSYGGGVQSTALLVLAAQARIDFRSFLMANVGDDSEHPATLGYVREVAAPYAAAHGIELVELHRVPTRGVAAGRVETLYGRLTRPGSRSLPIPVRMSNGAPGTRSCTADFKVRVVGAELLRRGASVTDPATVALGISTDEIERAKPGVDPRAPYQRRVYPLLDLGLSRRDCARIIAGAGLPVPPKSACWFCPFHDHEAWRRLKRDTPRCSPAPVRSKTCSTPVAASSARTRYGSPVTPAPSPPWSMTSSPCPASTAATRAGA